MERLVLLRPTSSSCFFSSEPTLFCRYIIYFSSTFSSIVDIFIKLTFFVKKLVVSFLTYCGHIKTFLLAVIARVKFDFTFPFLYDIIVYKLLLLGWRGGFFDYQPNFDFTNLHFTPFYCQIFNLLPLLLYFYYSTLVSILSILFLTFFGKYLKVFHMQKRGENGENDSAE